MRAYGQGIVRAQVDNTNLRAYATSRDITSAECIKACNTDNLFGQNYVDVLENLNDRKVSVTSTFFLQMWTRVADGIGRSRFETSHLFAGSGHAIHACGMYHRISV